MLAVHVYLIGYRGSGKSTVGRILSSRFACPYVDSDDAIEQAAQQSIREIFACEGESGFRDREENCVRAIASGLIPSIVSLGGGAILRENNRKHIRESGVVIWLRASPQTLHARIVQDAATADRRPNLSAAGGLAEVVDILARREPIYQEMANYIANADARDAEVIAEDVLRWLASDPVAGKSIIQS